MGRKKGKNKNNSHGQHTHGLSGGVSQVMEHPVAQTVTKGGLVLLTAIAAGGAGAALGKHSLIAGIPLALYGYHKNNQYLMAAGMGLVLSNGFQNPNKTTTVQGVDGIDFKQVAEEAKDRVGTFFKNFSEKLYLTSAEPTSTAGLEGNGKDEQVTYFVNPYNNSKELDMSAIDRLQEQIANMNKAGANGLSAVDEPDREF